MATLVSDAKQLKEAAIELEREAESVQEAIEEVDKKAAADRNLAQDEKKMAEADRTDAVGFLGHRGIQRRTRTRRPG